MYYRYKSSFLETTLSQIIDDEDGFDVPLDSDQSLQLDANFSLSFTDTPDDSSSFLSNFSNLDDVQSSSLINIRNVDDNHVIKDFVAEEVHSINANAWGSNLNKKQKKTSSSLSSSSASNSQGIRKSMTEKLFPMASFSKRNPRKSLSRSNTQTSSGSLTSSFSSSMNTTRETLPDLETILAQKALQEKERDLAQLPKLSNINVDKGWLNRCDDSGETKMDISSEEPARPKQYGLSNLAPQIYAKCTYDKNDQSDDDEVIENSEDESNMKPRNVRHVLKKRKVFDVRRADVTTNHLEDTSIECAVEPAKHVEPVDEIVSEPVKKPMTRRLPPKKPTKKPPASSTVLRRSSRATRATPAATTVKAAADDEEKSDSDPFADDSHSDPEFQPNDPPLVATVPSPILTTKKSTKASAKSKTKAASGRATKKNKKAADKEPDDPDDVPAEDMPEDYISHIEVANLRNIPRINIDQLKQDTALFHEYVNSATTIKPPGPPPAASPTKRELEREKLEKKIAAGKLNENFVRIDVRKKVFVRGKKTVNFSKYKKSKWKKLKAANALAGPDMDMRGCDGGFLVCHNCGQQGHFAQDCKIQCKCSSVRKSRSKFLQFFLLEFCSRQIATDWR